MKRKALHSKVLHGPAAVKAALHKRAKAVKSASTHGHRGNKRRGAGGKFA